MEVSKNPNVINEIINDKNDAEFNEIKYRKDTKGESKTIVPYYPLRDKVLVKITYEESMVSIRQIDEILKGSPKSVTVIGTGGEVENIDIGDEVHVSFNANIEQVHLKDNNKSIKKIHKLVDDNRKDLANKGFKKAIMSEFFVVPAYSINGIIVEDES